MTIVFTEIYSPTCHACQSTMHLVYQLETEFPEVLFRYVSVAEPRRFWDRINHKENEFLERHGGIPVKEDKTLSKEEREEYLKQGVNVLHSLPTFLIHNSENPRQIEVIAGGVGEDSPQDLIDEFMEDTRKMIYKWLTNTKPKQFEWWREVYDEMYTPLIPKTKKKKDGEE